MERLGIKLIVAEQDGMRRFLYPMRVRLPSLYRRLAGSLALAGAGGALVPSIVEILSSGDLSCLFALSLAPYESRELFLVRIDPAAESAIVPDPLRVEPIAGGTAGDADAGGFVSRQERVEFEAGSLAQLASVIYDGQQHLAGPLSITLDGHVIEPLASGGYGPELSPSLSGGLGARFVCSGAYPGAGGSPRTTRGSTELELTACKSWVWARHTLRDAQPGSILRFTLPLTVTSPVQTCDFGTGNGAYGKIEPNNIDEIAWEIDLEASGTANYTIQSHMTHADEARVDYAGRIKSPAELASRLWLHWIEPDKSLALAVTELPKSCRSVMFRLSDRGVLAAEFETGATPHAAGATYGICCHFLNDVPAIAAATNPASILSPPSVRVARSVG